MAEFMAVTEAVKESMWLQNLTSDLIFVQDTVEVYCDNQSAIYSTKNPQFHERTMT